MDDAGASTFATGTAATNGDAEAEWEVAVHEAGHAVAAICLGGAVVAVSIIPDADGNSLGHTRHHALKANWGDRLIDASYEASCGGFVNSRTRRWVEKRIMVCLAGGLATMRATGNEDHEVGMGPVMLSPAEAASMAAQYGGVPEDYSKLIVGGDLQEALDLAGRVSGSDDEADEYVGWLWKRTLNLMDRFDFWPSVEAVADALITRKRLSGRAVAKVISDAREGARPGRVVVTTTLRVDQ
jgi:hypothetical protein